MGRVNPLPLSPVASDESREEQLLELRPLVVRTVRLVVGAGSAIAEDAAQEALLELDRALPQLREPQAARAYAARIAGRVALRTARRERRFRLLGIVERQIEQPEPGQPAELVELKHAFDSLPPRQRAVAVLRLYVGLSEQETAEALGCGIGTVKRQLHDARAALRRYLRPEMNEKNEGGRA
jgi:RNA polymerase sigma factor (sigma-70 family)